MKNIKCANYFESHTRNCFDIISVVTVYFFILPISLEVSDFNQGLSSTICHREQSYSSSLQLMGKTKFYVSILLATKNI